MTKKKWYSMVISLSLVLVLALVACLINYSNTTLQTRTTTIEISRQEIDYQSLLDEFDDGKLEQQGSLTTFEGYKSLNLADLEGIDLTSDSTLSENSEVNVKYNFSYDKETNIVTLSAELKDEFGEIQIDTLTGAAFINDYGEIDAVMNVDGEGILLSEMQDAGMIANCGWFSRLIKKIVKVVVVAVAVGIAVAAVVATAGAAAPAVVAAGVGAIGTGASVAGTAIAAGATAAAVTAGVGLGVAAGEAIVEAQDGSITIGNTYKIGKEEVDKNNLELFKKVAETATLAGLREYSRVYHIAFVVSQKFTEGDVGYNVGDLYISTASLTFDEALAVLHYAEIINSLEKFTSNNEIIELIKNVDFDSITTILNTIKGYKSKGYFGKKAVGIYADSLEAAGVLAYTVGAFVKDKAIGFAAYGGEGGYYHFHDLKHLIHIWYGGKINA